MKIKLFVLFVIALSVNAVFGQGAAAEKAKTVDAKLPTAKKIIADYVKAIGGEKAYRKLTSRVIKGDLEFKPMGIKGTFEMTSTNKSMSIMKMQLAGIGEIVESFDGTTAWTVNPLEGEREKDGEELLQTKISTAFYKDIEMEKVYKELTVKGKETVDGSEAYVVEAKADGVPPETYYFDVKTGLMVRSDSTSVSPVGRVPVKNFYSDYKEIDGIKFPFTMKIITDQMEVVTVAKTIEHNVKVDDAMFTKK